MNTVPSPVRVDSPSYSAAEFWSAATRSRLSPYNNATPYSDPAAINNIPDTLELERVSAEAAALDRHSNQCAFHHRPSAVGTTVLHLLVLWRECNDQESYGATGGLDERDSPRMPSLARGGLEPSFAPLADRLPTAQPHRCRRGVLPLWVHALILHWKRGPDQETNTYPKKMRNMALADLVRVEEIHLIDFDGHPKELRELLGTKAPVLIVAEVSGSHLSPIDDYSWPFSIFSGCAPHLRYLTLHDWARPVPWDSAILHNLVSLNCAIKSEDSFPSRPRRLGPTGHACA
ncbi:hypothetical protein BV25DRAFT_1666806 [Artomyces pyxidatus]|uniref:Uncharacterized protein n=1 Tax=Artomyces pyxidatus TaxID=48021 RepID=A0ACB8SHD0_9AGAM|nr:hypothetical protein BV25DRAFT_1666806 [Artomyces pyxidatus]